MDVQPYIKRLEEIRKYKTETEDEIKRLEVKRSELEHTISRLNGAIDVLEGVIKEHEEG